MIEGLGRAHLLAFGLCSLTIFSVPLGPLSWPSQLAPGLPAGSGPPSWLQGSPSWLQGPPSWLHGPPSLLGDLPSWFQGPPSLLGDPPSWLQDLSSWLQSPPSWL